MIPLAIAAEVLGCDPSVLRAKQIKGGLTNESWQVTGPDTSVVVRISTVDELALQLDRANEELVLNLVQQAGIGAEVLLCAPERRVLVTLSLPAQTLTMSHLQEDRIVLQVAELLRGLHSLKVPASINSTHLLSVLDGYWSTLDAQKIDFDKNLRERARTYALESAQLSERCLCHHDVHHLNLMSNGQRLWLLDWEYAGLGDPLFDLAAICCYHDYDDRLRQQLLQAYRGSIFQEELQRLGRMCWLFDYIKTLWMQVRQLKHQQL
jgi:thiamine kinase